MATCALRNFVKPLAEKHLILIPHRFYRNALGRKPIRVFNARDVKNLESTQYLESGNFQKHAVPATMNETALTFPNEIKKRFIVPPYEKLQKNDARFTKLLGVLKSRKYREKSGQMLLEGKRLINDALEAGMELKTLFFSKEETLSQIRLRNPESVEICKVLYKTLKLWSDLTTCPGIMGVFMKPSIDDLTALSDSVIPVTVICDNIRDPGNLGSIIRNAASAGCHSILLTKGCVDPWESKVLRAACGGHFRIPIVNNINWAQMLNYIPMSSTIYVADNLTDVDAISNSEGYVDYNETLKETRTSEEDELDADDTETRFVSLNEHNQSLIVDQSYEDAEELEEFESVELPCHLYSSIAYPKKDIILYIGGETHGVDPRAIKLACEHGGKKIKIPLENGMESLNSSFAMTIVLYEIKRQLAESYITMQ